MPPTLTNPAANRQHIVLFMMLAMVMVGTRINHFSALPDASWAVFFLGGFYLQAIARWAFSLLVALAVLTDYYVITNSGVSFWNHYCVSIGYWFLLPAYLSLWLGGVGLRRYYQGLSLHSLGILLISFFAAVSLCFVISNGSFYWLSDSWLSNSVANRSVSGWVKNLGDWYLPYLYTTAIYIAGAALLHTLAIQIASRLPERSHTQTITHN